jgi:hypothetical protein
MLSKFKIEIKWGAIFFVMTLVWMFLEKIAGLHSTHINKHHIYTNLIAIPAIAIYVFALLDKKRNFYNGSMNYLEGFISGLIITLVVIILSPPAQLITSTIITPEYFPNAINHAVESGLMTREQAEQYFNTGNYIIQGLMGAPVMGILTSAVVAIFARTKSR